MDIVAQRFCQIFQDHGVEKSQIPRLVPSIKLSDLKSNKALLEVLTPEILDQTASLLSLRSEWLEGVDDVIYESRYCYKAPEVSCSWLRFGYGGKEVKRLALLQVV